MAFKRMTRMISFRVSDAEFQRLREKSQAEGARSVSDYARLALSHDAHDDHDWGSRLDRLSSEVQRLTALMDDSRLRSMFMAPEEAPAPSKKAWRNS